MHDRVKAAALFKQRIGREKLIEGWIEGPCAEAADLRGINTLMLDFYDDPAFVRDLFEFVVEMELRFAKAQIEAGIDIMGVGDAAASLVGPQIYQEFVLPYEKRMVDAVHDMGTRIRLHICGNIGRILEPHRFAGLRLGRRRLPGAPCRRPPADGAATGPGRQHRPGGRAPQRDSRVDSRRNHRMPSPGGPAICGRRRLRGSPRYAGRKPAGTAGLRPIAHAGGNAAQRVEHRAAKRKGTCSVLPKSRQEDAPCLGIGNSSCPPGFDSDQGS